MSSTRRTFLAAGAALALIYPAMGNAAETRPFDQKSFDAALKAGGPILVEITAPWCSTCRAQKPILSQLTTQPQFKNLQIFQVDFDSQKDAVRGLKAQMQSTLITFKGEKEIGRSVGDTRRDSIEALLNKLL